MLAEPLLMGGGALHPLLRAPGRLLSVVRRYRHHSGDDRPVRVGIARWCSPVIAERSGVYRCAGGGALTSVSVGGRIDGWVSYIRIHTISPDAAVSAATVHMAAVMDTASARMPARSAPTANPPSRHSR